MPSRPRPDPWPEGPGGKLEATFRGLYPGARSRWLRNRRAPPAGGRTGLARGVSFGHGSVRSAADEGGPAQGRSRPSGVPAERRRPRLSLPAPPCTEVRYRAGRQALLVPLDLGGARGRPSWDGKALCPDPLAPAAPAALTRQSPPLRPSAGDRRFGGESAGLRAARP